MSSIVTFGETMLRLSPPRGERLESAESLEFRTAGAESNVAVAAARLGTDVTWLSKLPESPLGRRVAGDIHRHGVDTEVIWSETGRQGTYYIDQGGEPRGTEVIYDREGSAVSTTTVGELDEEVIESADVFFTTGITPALSETLFDTTRSLLDTETTTGFDLNYRSKLWSEAEAREAYDELLHSVDILFAPERDVRNILDISGDAVDVVEDLRTRYGCETVVLTRGEAGALASTGDEVIEQPAFEAETVDSIGTGDAFVGGYLSRYVQGEPVHSSLRYGAAAAALKRTIRGDIAVITSNEVERVIDEGSGGISR